MRFMVESRNTINIVIGNNTLTPRITIAGELSQTLDELNFKKKQTEEQTNTSSNTKIEERLKEPEEKTEKDKLDTQALQERNQDVIRNKNQRIASLNEEVIELK